MEQNLLISNYNLDFAKKLKSTQKETHKKLRKQHLLLLKKRIQKFQIHTTLSFTPEIHNVLFPDSSIDPNYQYNNRKVQLKVSPKMLERRKVGLDRMLRDRKMNFTQEIVFPISTFSDFNLECNLFTKNGGPNFVFFVGPTFWIYNNFILKVDYKGKKIKI